MRHDEGNTLKLQDHHEGLRALPLKAMECEDYRVVFVFHDPQVLAQFVDQGWDFGAQADAAAKTGAQGGAASEAVSATPGMEIYQFTETGLALRAGLAGTKYWKDADLN